MHAAAVVLTTFALVFVAELPDKTAIASLLLGTRYRPPWVFAGVSAAFAFHVVLAVTAGSLLGLLPHRLLQGIVAGLFALGAVLLLRGRPEEALKVADAEPGFWHVAATGFTVVFLAEFGDLTQFVTANLAAHYRDPVAVGAGALAGLLCVAGLALAGGRALMRVLPIAWLTRFAALAMLTLAGFSLASAVTGLSSSTKHETSALLQCVHTMRGHSEGTKKASRRHQGAAQASSSDRSTYCMMPPCR